MRKFLLFAIATLMSVTMMAAGGDGSSKTNAIDFDWENGHNPALSAGTWYRVNLSPLKAEANDPTLALYLTNLTDNRASVSLKLEASVTGESVNQTSSYNIAAKDYQLWSRQNFDYNGRTLSLKQLMSLGLKEVYLQLTSSEEIALSAKVYETEDIVDDACSKAIDFDWSGVSVPKGEQWFRLNLSDVKSTDNKLKFVVVNNGSAEAEVSFDMSLDCPASAVIEKDWVIAPGAAMEDEFGRVFLDVLKEDYVYLKLTNDQPLTLSVEEEVVVIPPGKYDDFDCAAAPELKFDTELNLTAGQHIYKVKRDALLGGRSMASEFYVTNNGATPATLDVEVAFACPVKSTVDQQLVIEGNTTVVKAIKDNVLKSVDVEWVYIRFITDQDLTATVGKRNIDPCINAVPFDWTTGASLAAGESQWYEVDITSLKRDKKHLTLAFTNHSENIALVNVEVALDCNGTILPITLPIYGGLSIGQTIDYNLLKHSPLNRIYVGLSTDSHIEMSASVKDAIAADPSPCLNAINPEHGVEYTHEANTTNWYKISMDWLESTTDYSSFYLANKGSQRAHVTLGVVTDCQYTPSSRITLPMPTKFDLGILGPNVLGKLLKELARIERIYNKVDSKDIYLEIHSDQPIGFGLDVMNSTTNPCLRDDLITFDWNQGAKVEKGDGMKWYDMDLDAVKAAGKHVKLTFTNHADSLVWAATVVSVECPAKLTMPLIVPVPAGMSIDHVINYQLFAVADLHNIYIGVVTDGALELKAESIDAAIVPSADCLAAKKIVSGEEYVQSPGTQWYQFPMSLIDEMGNAVQLSFENRSSNHATLTAGVSVGCEYAPVTCAKAKVLRDIDMSLNMPKQIIAKLRGLIDPAITDFYLQLTTDQTIAFSIKNQEVGANACSNATVFNWNAWEQDGLLLEANKEEWFKVDLTDPVKQLMDGEDITLIFSNLEDTEIEVDLAVSPTCPVLLSLEKSLTIPAGLSAGVTVSLADIVSLLEQYDEHNLLDRDYKALLKKVNALTLYNKLNQMLTEYGYYDNVAAYVPVDRVDALFERYGEDASLVNLKKLLDDPKKYISVAEIKWHLVSVKEKVQGKAEEKLTFDNMIAMLEKYGDKIPHVDAEKIINNADLLLPYIGTANVVLDKCKQYITTDNLLKIVNRCKEYVPFAELKELKERVEAYLKQHLPDPSTVYIYAKSTGDLMISSEVATPEGCEDAELLDWTKTIDLSTLKTGWYRLDISSLHQTQSDFVLSLNNNTGAVKKLAFAFYEGCSPDGSAMTDMYLTSINVTAPEGVTTEKVPYAALKYLLGDEVMELYVYLEIEGGELNEACLNAMLLDDPNVPHTIQLVAGKEQWFKVATNALDKLQYNLKVSVDAEVSDVTVSVSSSCYVDPVVDTTVVLDQARQEEVELSKNTILDKWSKYSSKVSDIDTAYVRVLSTGNITLTTDTVTPTPPADPDACENATLLDWTQTINLSTLTTGWYKFDISSLHASQSDFSLSLNNDMGETKAVEMTLYLSCDQPYEAKTTQVFPVGITTRQVAYSLLTQVVGTADMIYVYIKTDVEVPVIPDADACLNAIELTWNDTLDINAGDTTWYMLPLAEAKALGKDLELTVSNNSGSVANVYVAVSEHCPVVAFLTERRGSVDPGSITKLLKHNELNSLADTVYFLLSSSESLSMSVSVYNPVPPTEPDSCLNGTLLDWTQTVNLSTLTTGWYKFDISSLHASQSDFSLSLNNDMGETKAVEMTLYLSCDQPYEAKTTQVFPVGITTRQVAYSLLTQVVGTADMIYVYIKTDVEVPVIPDADACLNAIELTWNDTLDINAGDTTWYMLPLAEAKALGKDLTLTVNNSNDVDADVYVAVAETCPVLSYLTERTGTIPANMTLSRTLTNSELNSLADTVYFRLSSTQDLTIVAGVAVEEPEQPEGCENATLLDWTKTINLSDLKTGWYKFDISSVHTANKDFTLSLNNDLGEKKNLGFRLYKDCDSPMLGETVMTFPVGITSRTIPASLLSLVDGIDMLYVYLTIDAPLPCEGAILFDWNKGAYQAADKTQWYEFDITPVLNEEKQVKLTFTNHSNENAWVIAELALNCPYTKSIPIIVPVPANMSVDKWIDYSVFEASRIEHFYLGVTTREAAIELAATWEDARVTPSDGCLNATLVQTDSLYEHAAGTHWYKLTGDLFEGEGSFSRVHVINRSAKTVNITAGGTVGCEYNIATRTSFKLPRRFDLVFAIPVWVVEQMKKFVDDDVKEFYLELTTDQPIAFSFGMDACEEAIPFDWTTGHMQEALTTQWYDVDIAPVLANEQQIKLTLTNHSDQTAWVATLVSLDCPFKVALPLAFPIPAGMSVDKVIDYSYFAATKLDHLYVGVTTDSKISILAEAQSAEASATDKDGCANATLLENAKNYTHPGGTAWYKVDGSFLANMSTLPTFRFATVSGETTKVTMGATVGCEYNIATKGSVSVPGGVDLSLRVPSFIFKALKHIVREDVNEFYVQLTTDKEIEFAIDTTTAEDLIACLDAIDLVVTDSMVIDLAGNTDQWYKVDLSALKGTNKDLAIKAVNPAANTVEVEVEISATCPVVASVMKNATVPASLNVTKVVTAEQIAKLFEKYPDLVYYVRVRTSGDLHAEISEYIPPVDGCANAIDYVWGTDLELNANEEGWYKLAIVDLKEQSCNIKLTVKNETADTVTADLDLFETCPIDLPIVSMEGLEIAPTTTRIEEVSSDYLPDGVDTVYLRILPTGKLIVNVSTNCIPDPVLEYKYDTIAALVCDNSEYVSPVSQEKHLINSADASTLTWNDTVHVHATLDSVFTFLITPIVAPEKMTDAILETIYGAMPVLQQGVLASVDTAAISDYYKANDTEAIADVVSVVWKATRVDCDATSHTMTLVVTDACGNEIMTDHTFPVAVRPTGAVEVVEICGGEDYLWSADGKHYDKTGIYTVTVQDINGCDSIVTLDLRVWPATEYVNVTKTICYGESYEWPVNGEICDETKVYTHTVQNKLFCDSIIYTLQLTVLPQPVEVVEDTVLCHDEHLIWHNMACDATRTYTYESTNDLGCVDTIFTLNVKVLPETIDTTEHIVICKGEVLTWKDGQDYTATTTGATFSEQFAEANCDSIIYTLDLIVIDGVEHKYDGFCYGESYKMNIAGKDTVFTTGGTHVIEVGSCGKLYLHLTEYDYIPVTHIDTTICYGQAFEWNHISIDGLATQDYTYTTHHGNHNCDSIVVLHVTVLPEAVTMPKETATVCYGETYTWNADNNVYDATGVYTYVVKNSLDCDSIIYTLDLTVLPKSASTEADTICQGETYSWYGKTLNATGTYEHILKDINGCDSVLTLNLTVLPATKDQNKLATFCEGDSVVWNDSTYFDAGIYTKTLTDANGCEYQSTLEVVVLKQGQDTVIDKTLCYGDSIEWNGKVYKTTTSDTLTLAECDATITLNLTILPEVQPSEEYATVCYGGSYDWNGATYNVSDTYKVTLKDVNGCDSVAILHLTVLPETKYEVTDVTRCYGETYTWDVNGQTYSATKSDTIYEPFAGTQCDSLVAILNLTILPEALYEVTDTTICYGETYTWIDGDGLTYATSVTGLEYPVKYVGTQCDSVIHILNLTIQAPLSDKTEVYTICEGESVEWNGNTYTTTTKDTVMAQDSYGCEYLSILDLKVLHQGEHMELDTTLCYGDSITWNGKVYKTTINLTDTLDECDATATLKLTVLPEVQPIVDNVTICHGETYTWNGATYNASATYTTYVEDANGCSGKATLNLTVLPKAVENVTNKTLCYGETYTWDVNGQIYSETKSDTVRMPFANAQCDSVINILHLTILPETKYEVTDLTLCAGSEYEWIDGKIYKQTETATYTVPYAGTQCDSLVATLNLTILPETKYEVTDTTICYGDTYTWIDGDGLTYATSVTGLEYPVKYVGTQCDSVIHILNLTIQAPLSDKTEVYTICEGASVEWNGKTYTTTTKDTVMAQDSYGCEYLSILDLKVLHQGEHMELDTTLCYGDSIMWNGKAYKTTINLTDTLDECDATATLKLTVLPEVQPIVDNVTICHGETYTWNGATYNASATYTTYVEDANGCFGKATLNLTVLPKAVENVTNKTLCYGETYTWDVNGQIYSETKSDTVRMPFAGTLCDSVIHILNLKVHPKAVEEPIQVETICHGETFTWNGQVCSVQKEYMHVIPNKDGCDSVIQKLYLVVRDQVKPTVTNQTICYGDTYDWDNQQYTATDKFITHTMTLDDANGCDSVVTLNLYVHDPIAPTTDTVILCYGDTLTWNGGEYYQTGKYPVTLKSVITNCDSLVYLDLTVLPEIPATTEYVSIPYNTTYTWPANGITYGVTGVYTDTLPSVEHGCDSIVHLDLTILPPVVKYEYDTIATFVCDGTTDFVDHITGEKHVISSLVPSTLKWQDTVHVHAELDSVYVFDITPIVAPDTMTDATLETILGVMPVLAQGEMPNVDVVAIETYYRGIDNDTISNVDTLYWITDIVACGAKEHTMTLVVEDECDNVLKTVHTFPVAQPTVAPIVTEVICYEQAPYHWDVNDSIYTETGIYKDTLVSKITGCDSIIVTLDLTIRPQIITVVDTTMCASDLPFKWPAVKENYYSDTTVTKVFSSVLSGCDSIVTLHLTVLRADTIIQDTTICSGDSFEWHEQLVDESKLVYYDTAYYTSGCDSVYYELHLTVNEPSYRDTTITICSGELPYMWRGIEMVAAGDTSAVVGVNAVGCDSIVTLHLIVNEPSYRDTTITICSGELPFEHDGITMTAAGDTTYVFGKNTVGCDSIVTLYLIVNEPSYRDTTITICSGELPFEHDGITMTAAGDTTYVFGKNTVGCDSIVTLYLIVNEPSYRDTTITICSGELPFEHDGITMTAAGDTTYVFGKNTVGCDSIVTLHLIVNEPSYGDTTAVICSGELPFIWYEHTLNETTTATHTLTNAVGCDSIVTLHLTVNEPSYGDTTAVICSGELPFIWYEHTLNETTTATHTLTNAVGCDSIVTLHLTVNEPSYGDTTATIYPYQLPYQWYEITMTEAGDTSRVWGLNAAGCDSIVTLHLIVDHTVIRSEVDVVDTVCVGTEYQGRLTTKTINQAETWTDSIHVLVNGVPTDSIYNYMVQVYATTLPVVTSDDIIAICGNAIDVTPADAIIQAHIQSPLYAAVEAVIWEVKSGEVWETLTSTALDGNLQTVTVRYIIQTACEDITSDDITVDVVTPTPENDVEMANMPAYNKYGGRLLTVDIKQIKDEFGWDVAEEDVVWYRVVNANHADSVGSGYYLTTADGTPLPAGEYYARINHTRVVPSECDGILQTVCLIVGQDNNGPKLVPTIARPHELIQLLNLDPDAVSTVNVYSTTGELIETFQVKDKQNTTFPAAHLTGYYIVDVQTETEKVSLRYIVK